jgi:ABC-type glycerol-3-phosphate transport system substrate-binding protein
VRKSIVWPCLLVASLALAGCGGGEPAEEPKPAAAKKKGEKEEVSTWAKDGPPGSEPAEAPKKKAKKKGKKGEEEAASPWAKATPAPAAT